MSESASRSGPRRRGSRGGVTLLGAGACLDRFLFAVLRGRMGYQRRKQVPRGVRDFLNRGIEGRLVGGRRLARPADLADVLEGGRVDLVGRRRWLKVVQGADVATHASTMPRLPSLSGQLRASGRPGPATQFRSGHSTRGGEVG